MRLNNTVLRPLRSKYFGAGGQSIFRLTHIPTIALNRFLYASEVDSQPTGTQPPHSILLALKGGSLSSYGKILGSGDLVAHLISGKACTATLVGSGTISAASLSLIVQLAATLSGVGLITQATMQAISSLSATLSGSGTITEAQLGAIIQLAATLNGSGTISSATLRGIASLSSSIEIAQTTGISVGDILGGEIETGFSLQDALRLILSSTAGKVSGAETTTITFRNVTDDKDRIIATVDANGNRTSITYDVGD